MRPPGAILAPGESIIATGNYVLSSFLIVFFLLVKYELLYPCVWKYGDKLCFKAFMVLVNIWNLISLS